MKKLLSPADVLRRRDLRRRKALHARLLLGRSLLTVIAAAIALVFLLPTVLTFTNSFMSGTELASNYGMIFSNITASGSGKTFIAQEITLKFIPDMVSAQQYLDALFKTPEYLLKFWNSMILVVPIVVFQLFVAAFAAYGFARWRGKLKSIIFFLYVILMLMPYQVTLVPNYLVSDWLGILETRWAIWLPGIFSPFSVYILTKYMRRIPSAYIEAAKLDGANEWQVFLQVSLPLCQGALFSVAILVFIDYWNMVEQPLILLTDPDLQPLSVFLSQVNTGDAGLAFAVATIYMVPTLLLFLYGEDYLVEGIAYAGGIKG